MSDFLTDWKRYSVYYEAMREMASLTKLFNNYKVPKIDYQFCETCYCEWFNAQNVSTGSTPFDAILGILGVGLKTFIYEGNETWEKVSEFNKIAPELKGLSDIEIVRKISILKNERLTESMKKYGVTKTIYFCVGRRSKKDEEKNGIKELLFFIYDYSPIDISNITITDSTDKRILFNDGINDYKFTFSKSTLYQRFVAPEDTKYIQFKVNPNPWRRLIRPKFEKLLEWFKIKYPQHYNKETNTFDEETFSLIKDVFEYTLSQAGFDVD